MYEISDIQDYKQKWLEAERALAINWVELPSDKPNDEPIDNVDNDTERVNKSFLPSRNLEDYQPGATQTRVFEALKTVAKSRKPSQKHAEPPSPTS